MNDNEDDDDNNNDDDNDDDDLYVIVVRIPTRLMPDGRPSIILNLNSILIKHPASRVINESVAFFR